MKNLFLTGPVGCGKSTSIAAALADALKLPVAHGQVRADDDDTAALIHFFLINALADVQPHALSVDGKVIKEGEQIQLGGNESYISLCRKHWTEGKVSP